MDNRLIVTIRDDRTLPTGYHKSILYALVSRGDNAFPNQSQLMKDAGIGSRNTLIKTIKELEALGWLTITKDRWATNQYKNIRYKVHAPNMTEPCIKSDEVVVKSDTLKVNKDKHKDKHNNKNIRNPRGNVIWKESNIASLDWYRSHSEHNI